MSAGSNPARRPSLAMLSNRDSSGDPLATTRWFIWYIPVKRDARPGAHGAAWLNWEAKRTPSRQSRSRCGVWTTGWPAADRQSALNWSRVTKSTFTSLTLAARVAGGHHHRPSSGPGHGPDHTVPWAPGSLPPAERPSGQTVAPSLAQRSCRVIPRERVTGPGRWRCPRRGRRAPNQPARTLRGAEGPRWWNAYGAHRPVSPACASW